VGGTPSPGLPGDWNGLVIVVAGVTWEGNRLGAQHIAERLTRYAPVLYVDPPRTPMSVIRKPWLADSQHEPRLRLLADRLARLTPIVPPLKTRVGGRVLAASVMRRQLRRAINALGADVHALIDIPPHFPVFGVAKESLKVHLASDDFVAGARLNGVSSRWVQRQEQRVAREADRIVTVSPVLWNKWQALGHHPVLITNGCDYELFAAVDEASPATDVCLPRPIAGFIGTLSERTDIAFLDAVAARGHSLLLVGPRSHTAPHAKLDAVLTRPNVQWVGRRSHKALPSYLRHVDVGLVPYTDNDFNRASFPLKVLDYLSAGLPVVATDLPSMRWLQTDLIDLVSDAEGFVNAVAAALRNPRNEQLVAHRRRYASSHSWDIRVAQLADVLDLTPREAEQTTNLLRP
jgi:teichuronic acid biosynthesis glycosyltransferase TuaH